MTLGSGCRGTACWEGAGAAASDPQLTPSAESARFTLEPVPRVPPPHLLTLPGRPLHHTLKVPQPTLFLKLR